MKVFEWTPDSVVDDDGNKVDTGFTGKATIDIPNYKERITLLQEMGLTEDKVGIESTSKMIDLVERSVKTIDFLHESGEKITTVSDLGYSREGAEVINHMGRAIIGGVRLGKPLK